MSLNIEGENCALCHAYLFEDDDIVYCPTCGAPHHRGCYNSVGHCALETTHGTAQQYTRPAESKTEVSAEDSDFKNGPHTVETRCNMCGESYDINEGNCPNCGALNMSRLSGGRFATFDFLGGVPADMDLGGGVTADEAKKFVSTNTHRYIPKFAAFKTGKRASWNWLALLTPCGWFLSRKMYAAGALVGALQVAFTMLAIPFSNALYYLDISSATGYIEKSNLIMENLHTIGVTAIIAAAIGSILTFALHIISAVFGDYFYKKRVISAVSDIKNENTQVEENLSRMGGINLILGLVGIFAVENLPAILYMMLGI